MDTDHSATASAVRRPSSGSAKVAKPLREMTGESALHEARDCETLAPDSLQY